jgi:hypothetical protein
MAVLSSPAVDLEAMGEASRSIVGLYTPETWAQGLADCIERTTVRGRELVAEGRSRWAGLFKPEKQPG